MVRPAHAWESAQPLNNWAITTWHLSAGLRHHCQGCSHRQPRQLQATVTHQQSELNRTLCHCWQTVTKPGTGSQLRASDAQPTHCVLQSAGWVKRHAQCNGGSSTARSASMQCDCAMQGCYKGTSVPLSDHVPHLTLWLRCTNHLILSCQITLPHSVLSQRHEDRLNRLLFIFLCSYQRQILSTMPQV